MPNIFRYTDYRKYLRDAIKAMRKKDPSLSYRALARHIGLLAPSHIFLVIQAKRNLGDFLMLKFSAFLKLKRKEMFYFEHMAHYNQSQTKFEKDEYYRRMAALNSRLKKRK
jgi:uncharacterized protein (TIGR02147 family)